MCIMNLTKPKLEVKEAQIPRDINEFSLISVFYAPNSNEEAFKDYLSNKYKDVGLVEFVGFLTIEREDLTLQLLQSLLRPFYIRNESLACLKNRFDSIVNSQDHGIDIQYDQLFSDVLTSMNANGIHVLILLGNHALIQWGKKKDKERFKLVREAQCTNLHFVMFTSDKHDIEGWKTNLISEFSTLIKMDADKVYFSYNWEEQSNNIVDAVQKALTQERIVTVRDKDDCHYRDSIRKFENEIGQAKKVIVVFSEAYLKSASCMYEMNRIIACGNIEERIFPIVTFSLSDDNLNGIMADTQNYWKNKSQEITAQKTELIPGTHEIMLDQEFVINETLNNFTRVWNYLRDTCSKTKDQLLENDCALLVEELRKI